MSAELEALLRKNVRELAPYQSARDEFSGSAEVFLDANENSFGSVINGCYHRYPDPRQTELKKKISRLKGVPESSIFIGNGSDEAIDLLLRALCEPGQDRIIITPPTYGMYAVSAGVNNVSVLKVPLDNEFQVDAAGVLAGADQHSKILFLCSPNNPTGNCMTAERVERLLDHFPGVVVIDEAYIDFAPEKSFLGRIKQYPKLVILQTFSKAWGLAGLRVGMAFGGEWLINALNRIKPPYNVNQASQRLAIQALAEERRKQELVQEILAQRVELERRLMDEGLVSRIFPSDANFLLVTLPDAHTVYQQLIAAGIVVRDRSNAESCADCLRITVGTPGENERLLDALRKLKAGEKPGGYGAAFSAGRSAEVHRVTKETDIQVRLSLDGHGRTCISTGLGFFDHMLEQLARHSGCDLFLQAHGDWEVDEHHVIEDTGLALGEALKRALGERRGIERYGFVVPMDESLAQAALDLSGRSELVWRAELKREKIGAVPAEMFPHFFKAFCSACGCTLHVEAHGENEHHKVEAVFKAVARALGQAIRCTGGAGVPSTKGVL